MLLEASVIGLPITAPSHTQNYSDTASVIWGKHTLRFGGVFANGGVDYYRARYGRGLVYFDDLTSYLQGIPSDSGAWNFCTETLAEISA
jgi:hypothetical protein